MLMATILLYSGRRRMRIWKFHSPLKQLWGSLFSYECSLPTVMLQFDKCNLCLYFRSKMFWSFSISLYVEHFGLMALLNHLHSPLCIGVIENQSSWLRPMTHGWPYFVLSSEFMVSIMLIDKFMLFWRFQEFCFSLLGLKHCGRRDI